MANFPLTIPSLGNTFVDLRDVLPGNAYTWSWTRRLSEPKYIAIHHSAGPDTQTPADIARFHINSNGWGGIGYHFTVDKTGIVSYVGDLTTARANVADANDLVIGVCLIGNFTTAIPPKKQVKSTHDLVSHLLFHTPELTNVNGWEDIVPHKHFGGTACPGDTWEQWKGLIITGVDTPIPPTDTRSQHITQLYQLVLGRTPDTEGLKTYVQSKLSIEEIRKQMTESSEHQLLIAQAKNAKLAKALAQEAQTHLVKASESLTTIAKLS